MAEQHDKPSPPAYNMNAMNAGMFGFAIPMPIPVFTPQVMPIRMIPPFWPPNSTSFMQQYMEAMSSGMAQVMSQSSVSQKELSCRATSREDATSLSLGTSVIPSALENTSNESRSLSLTGYGKRQGTDLLQFPNPMLFPFGGFVPFGPYFPCYNAPGNGFTNKQSKDYECPSTETSQINDLESNDALEKREVNKQQQQQPLPDCEGRTEESSQVKPVITCSEVNVQESPVKDSHMHEISDINSPEMDVARILVNFMPVPVISGVKQHKRHSPEKGSDVPPNNKTIIKESVLDPPSTVVSTGSNSSTSPDKTANPENVTSVKYVSCSCAPVLEKDLTIASSGVSAIKDSPPKQLKQSSTALSSVKKQEMSVQYNNNYIINGNTSMEEQVNQKHNVKVSDTVPSSTVVHLINSQDTNPPQEDQPSVTYVKSESPNDIKMHNEITENKPVELIEMAPKSEEYQQGAILDDENTIPTVDDLLKGDLGGDKSTYKCEVCAQLFRSSLGLQKHLEFHMDDGQHYTCTICFQPFKEAKSLDDHIALHMRNRPHKCTFCPKAFRDPGSLQKHVRVHTGEKPYKCTSCYQSFAEYSSLRKHLRVHTGEQPYRCQYCNKAFSISGNLQRHVLIHTGERPYKCSFCPKAFNNPSHLRRHVKNLHFKGEATTGVVEDMISAIHGEVGARVKKSFLGNEMGMEEHNEQSMEISQEEEVVV